ncbi:MAG: hypothetical protein RBT67_16165 [Thauera sp.]|jgi:hypothetical protein|nr:hypothetical protein [Thauera sp.]
MAIPNHAEAVSRALLELARAYLAGPPGPGAYPADARAEDYARAIRRDLTTDAGRTHWFAVLDERVDGVTLPPAVLLRLLADAAALPHALRQMEAAERSSNACWERVDSACRIMREHDVDYEKRVRKALFELGLTGEAGGKGKARVDHHLIADHYYALRCGERWEGQALPPHSHVDAVRIIEDRHGVDWESLRRAWRRKGIVVSTEAEVFPIK